MKTNPSSNRKPGPSRNRWGLPLLAAAALSLFSLSCADKGPTPWAMRPITKDMTFPGPKGGTPIQVKGWYADMGRQHYVHYCYACHGMNGDGKGPASHGYRPPPRDFRTAAFKFGAVRSGDLPSDKDLKRIIRGGLHGSAMLKWDIPEEQLDRIVQFIKTFPASPCDDPKDKKCAAKLANYPDSGKPNRWAEVYKRGKKKGQPKPYGKLVELVEDPWTDNVAVAQQKGKELYHLKAQCANCHPSYITQQEFSDLSVKLDGKPKTDFRKDMYGSIVLAAKDNPYGAPLMAPDFTLNPLRSIRGSLPEDPKRPMNDLYRLIASGVGGVMPAWIDGLKPKEIWALAHYVRSLMHLRRPDRRADLYAMQDKLAKQGPLRIAPKPAPPKPAAEAGADESDKEEDKGATDKPEKEAAAADKKPAKAAPAKSDKGE